MFFYIYKSLPGIIRESILHIAYLVGATYTWPMLIHLAAFVVDFQDFQIVSKRINSKIIILFEKKKVIFILIFEIEGGPVKNKRLVLLLY